MRLAVLHALRYVRLCLCGIMRLLGRLGTNSVLRCLHAVLLSILGNDSVLCCLRPMLAGKETTTKLLWCLWCLWRTVRVPPLRCSVCMPVAAWLTLHALRHTAYMHLATRPA